MRVNQEPYKKSAKMNTTKKEFGALPDGRTAMLYTIQNRQGTILNITDYGGIVTGLQIMDKQGEMRDVVLGFDRLEKYTGDHPYFGCIVGRYANRIRNGEFTLDGKKYKLARNHGNHHLHGGEKGFDKKLWESASLELEKRNGVKLFYLSRHMEEGYPGNLAVHVTYSLSEDNELIIEYFAKTDAPTVLNLTHHGYFNLNGARKDVKDHFMMINADGITQTDDELIPTGEIMSVENTPRDLRKPRQIGNALKEIPRGFDDNYVINHRGKGMEMAARTYDLSSGLQMEVFTTEPGVQFYTANFLDGITGKNNISYGKHHAICLEAQHFPDSVHQPDFPATVLRPGQVYHQETRYRFSLRGTD